MLVPQNGDRAELYLRLSRDDDTKKESYSITNQRKILTAYAEEHNFKIIDEYIDDGVSGTSFHRPGFDRMIEDAKAGKINVIIVKDLSRLGRNYLGSGDHIENVFPKLGVRFISIGDNYDSLFDDEPSADMVPIINFFNEFHAKQTSRKTRASKKVMAQGGKFIGTKAPFGYVIDPDDKHHLLVDEEAAPTVRLIFQYACDGLGFKAIAKRLRDAGVMNPTAYNNIKFPTLHKSEYWRQPHDWHPSSIKTILTNPTYLGKIVSGRRRVKSFKDKEILKMPEENWIVVDGMHEPLIDQKTWDTAQKKLAVRKRSDNQGAQQIFAGLVKCADCGYALAYTYNKGNSRYQCSLYNVKGKGYCCSHFITYDALYQAVLFDVSRRAKAAAGMDRHLVHRLKHETSGMLRKREQLAEKECADMSKRIGELEVIIGKLYEDSALGKITPERFQKLLDNYEAEQKELTEKRDSLQKELSEQKKKADETESFLQLITGYKDIRELTAPMLNELIDRIEVGTKQTVDGVKKQEIRIVYKQFCYVEFGEMWNFPTTDEQRTTLIQIA